MFTITHCFIKLIIYYDPSFWKNPNHRPWYKFLLDFEGKHIVKKLSLYHKSASSKRYGGMHSYLGYDFPLYPVKNVILHLPK